MKSWSIGRNNWTTVKLVFCLFVCLFVCFFNASFLHNVYAGPQGPLSHPRKCRSSAVSLQGCCRSDGSHHCWHLQEPQMVPVWLATLCVQKGKRYKIHVRQQLSASFFLWVELYCHLLDKWCISAIKAIKEEKKICFAGWNGAETGLILLPANRW